MSPPETADGGMRGDTYKFGCGVYIVEDTGEHEFKLWYLNQPATLAAHFRDPVAMTIKQALWRLCEDDGPRAADYLDGVMDGASYGRIARHYP